MLENYNPSVVWTNEHLVLLVSMHNRSFSEHNTQARSICVSTVEREISHPPFQLCDDVFAGLCWLS